MADRDVDSWEWVGQAYGSLLQHPSEAFRIFWLPGLVWVMATIAMEAVFVHQEAASAELAALALSNEERAWITARHFLLATGVAFGLFAFQSIVMASGLVRWMRFLVRGGRAERARLWLNHGEWAFFWRWISLGILFTLAGLGVIAVLLGVAFAFDSARTDDTGWFSPARSGLAVGWSFVLGLGLVCWLLPRAYLSLPALAVAGGVAEGAALSTGKVDLAPVVLAMVAAVAPLIFVSVALPVMVAAPASELTGGLTGVTTLYIAAHAIASVSGFVAMVVFAALLAKIYLSCARPVT